MNFVQICCGLQLHDEFLFNEKVQPVLTDLSAPVENGDDLLPLMENTERAKFQAKSRLVDRLQKTRPKLPMNSQRDGNYFAAEFFVLDGVAIHWLGMRSLRNS